MTTAKKVDPRAIREASVIVQMVAGGDTHKAVDAHHMREIANVMEAAEHERNTKIARMRHLMRIRGVADEVAGDLARELFEAVCDD